MAGSEATLGKTLGHGDWQSLYPSVIQQLYTTYHSLLLWYSYNPPAMILSIQQYSHHDSYIDTATCYVTRLFLIQQSSCYDSRQTAIPQLRYSYWYRNLPCFSAPIITTIPMQAFCTATSTAIPHYDPHTDTTICYDTKPLIIQKSICYDTIITAKLPIRYSYWYSNLPYYYTFFNTATSLLWS